MAYWIIIILIVVIGSISPQNVYVIAFQALWFCLSFYFDNRIKVCTDNGARFKESFDNYVFGWKTKIGRSDIVDAKEVLSKRYKGESSVEDLKTSVTKWYENIGEKDSKIAIRSAMEENSFYDKQINELLKIILIVVLLSFFAVCYLKNISMDKIVSILFITFASLFKKFIITWNNLNRVKIMNNEISDRLKNATDLDDLKEIQPIFYRKRLIPGVSNRFIYSIKYTSISKESKEIFK